MHAGGCASLVEEQRQATVETGGREDCVAKPSEIDSERRLREGLEKVSRRRTIAGHCINAAVWLRQHYCTSFQQCDHPSRRLSGARSAALNGMVRHGQAWRLVRGVNSGWCTTKPKCKPYAACSGQMQPTSGPPLRYVLLPT